MSVDLVKAGDVSLDATLPFLAAVRRARASDPRVAHNVSEYSARDYAGMRTFLSTDGRSGFAITHAGDLVSVFSTVKGRGNNLVDRAVREGARTLDCWDGYLVTLYRRHGFVVTSREPDWAGGPVDVVMMARGQRWGTGRACAECRERAESVSAQHGTACSLHPDNVV